MPNVEIFHPIILKLFKKLETIPKCYLHSKLFCFAWRYVGKL